MDEHTPQHQAETEKRVPPTHAPCAPAEAWTCTVQCPTLGTRSPEERIAGAPGVEVCKVVACLCAQQEQHPGLISVAPIYDPYDPSIALVIFGAGLIQRIK